MICAKLNDFVRADSNGKRTDFILSDYEIKASYVDRICELIEQYCIMKKVSSTIKGNGFIKWGLKHLKSFDISAPKATDAFNF